MSSGMEGGGGGNMKISSPPIEKRELTTKRIVTGSNLLMRSVNHYLIKPVFVSCTRSSMLVEVVLTICLYYLRSYYPGIPGLTRYYKAWRYIYQEWS